MILAKVAIVALALSAAVPAQAEFCYKKVDNTIAKLSGYRWQWRTVDGKQCWFYSNTLLPRTDLVWSFTEEEFNSDIDRILERKFYKPTLDENQLLIEAK